MGLTIYDSPADTCRSPNNEPPDQIQMPRRRNSFCSSLLRHISRISRGRESRESLQTGHTVRSKTTIFLWTFLVLRMRREAIGRVAHPSTTSRSAKNPGEDRMKRFSFSRFHTVNLSQRTIPMARLFLNVTNQAQPSTVDEVSPSRQQCSQAPIRHSMRRSELGQEFHEPCTSSQPSYLTQKMK